MKRPTANKVTRHGSLTSLEDLIRELKELGDPKAVAGMSRYGIRTDTAFGVSVPALRELAKKTGMDHELALQLWQTGSHEARLLAGMIDDPASVTLVQMEQWASGFDSWDVVDGTCGNLFDKTRFAAQKAHEWSSRNEEYVKRAGFVMMAELAVHDKKAGDMTFLEFLPLIFREASDDRNFVKKAVNWALRQIGKRNVDLNIAAVRCAKRIQSIDSRSAKWIAADALREITSPSIQNRLKNSMKNTSKKA
jgi:3-methyladenine DNA glycosylase AlkD